MNSATLEARAARTEPPAVPTVKPAPLSEREATAAVLAALLREARADGSRTPHDAFVSIRFDAAGGVTISSRFSGLYFLDTNELAAWLVDRCRNSQPEATHAQAVAA